MLSGFSQILRNTTCTFNFLYHDRFAIISLIELIELVSQQIIVLLSEDITRRGDVSEDSLNAHIGAYSTLTTKDLSK